MFLPQISPWPHYPRNLVRANFDYILNDQLAGFPDRVRRAQALVEFSGSFACSLQKEMANDLRLAVAYLDIGYGATIRSGISFHPLDGAAWAHAYQLSEPVVRAIFEHSASRVLARLHPVAPWWYTQNPEKLSPLSMYATYCDLQVDSRGRQVSLDGRLQDIHSRFGEEDPRTIGFANLIPYFREVVKAVEYHTGKSQQTPQTEENL